MTVLEKIKRCVSLVWDFQEIYGEEDIEDFCSNELHTYPQHNEIMEYFKHVEELEKENAENESEARELNIRVDGLIKENAELKKRNAELRGMYVHSAREAGTYKQFLELKEKENAELKEKYAKNIADCNICDTYCNSQFTKAKEIIREFVEWANWQGNSKCPSFKSIQNKAEQFISEVEK